MLRNIFSKQLLSLIQCFRFPIPTLQNPVSKPEICFSFGNDTIK